MFDIGWPELMLVAVVTVIVVGPRELPRVMRTVNNYMRKARSLATEFRTSVEDMAREADLEDIRKQAKQAVNSGVGLGDLENDIKGAVDPLQEAGRSARALHDDMRSGTLGQNPDRDNATGEGKDGVARAERPLTAPEKLYPTHPPPSARQAARDKAAEKSVAPAATPTVTPSVAKRPSAGKKAGAKKSVAKKAAARKGAKAKSAGKAAAKKPVRKPVRKPSSDGGGVT